mgnify:CR=1 FL=1
MLLFSATDDDLDLGDDDWGWDGDGNGDVELANNSHSSPRHNTLQTSRGSALKQRSHSGGKNEFGHALPIHQNQQQQYPTTSPRQQEKQQVSAQPPAQRITSLGVPKVAAKKAPAPAPKEDDIFASMGLAAQPKFQTSRPASSTAVRSAPTSGSSWGGLSGTSGSASSAAPRTSAVAARADSFDDNDEAWDDDLNDLLDD